MDHKQLISLLKTLTNKEFGAFFRHLKRQHSENLTALKVLEYLKNIHPKFNAKNLSAGYAYREIFEQDISTDRNGVKKLRNACSELYIRLKNYLISMQVQRDKLLHEMAWIHILKERKMEAPHAQSVKKFYNRINQKKFRQTNDAFERLVAGYHYWDWLLTQPPVKNLKKVHACAELLTGCLQLQQLKLLCLESWLKKFRKLASSQSDKYSPQSFHLLRDLYDSLWKMTETGHSAHFDRMEELLNERWRQIAPEELQIIIQYIHGFSARHSRKRGGIALQRRAHAINKIGLAAGVFQQNGKIGSTTFSNIVTIASYAKEFKWAEEFIVENSSALADSVKENTLLLARAALASGQNHFQKVLDLLEGVHFKEHGDVIRAWILLIKSHYELKSDQETILNACRELEKVVRRPEMSETDKGCMAFQTIVKLLTIQKSAKALILKRINTAEHLYSQEWLLEKINSYKPRYAARKTGR